MLRLVLHDGIRLTAIGVGVGLMVALAAASVMQQMVYGTSVRDPLVFAFVAGLIALVALLACVIPARRATRVDPVVALRAE